MNSDREELDREPTVGTEPAAESIPAETAAGKDAPPQTEPPASDGMLVHLQEQLREMRQRFDATEWQIAGYLREKTGPKHASEANGEAMAHVQEGIDRLLSRFDEMKAGLSLKNDQAAQTQQPEHSLGSQEVLETLKKLAASQEDLARKIVGTLGKRLSEELDLLRFQQIVHETLTTEWDRREAEAEAKARAQAEAEAEAEALAESELDIALAEVVEEPPEPESDLSAAAWSRAIWGAELTETPEFQPYLKELNRRLLEEDSSVAALAGQMLVFRHASPEAKPQLLKDVGEAYYRTRIDAADGEHPFERILIRWLQKDCDRAGLPNTIEVVHVGERFDKSRHSSTTRGGAEVAEVFGWVVLTEGGRVYTRASVAAH